MAFSVLSLDNESNCKFIRDTCINHSSNCPPQSCHSTCYEINLQSAMQQNVSITKAGLLKRYQVGADNYFTEWFLQDHKMEELAGHLNQAADLISSLKLRITGVFLERISFLDHRLQPTKRQTRLCAFWGHSKDRFSHHQLIKSYTLLYQWRSLQDISTRPANPKTHFQITNLNL